MNKPIIPIKRIGEEKWIDKLTHFLGKYDIDVKGLDFDLKIELSQEVRDYYNNFGGINSHDFMYNLYKPENFKTLAKSDWEFVKEHFSTEYLDNYLVFSESPSNDPICIDLSDFSIYLFSYDPLEKMKVFKDFNQYLRYEIIELQKLMGDIKFDKEEEISFHKEHLDCDNVDYDLRYTLLC